MVFGIWQLVWILKTAACRFGTIWGWTNNVQNVHIWVICPFKWLYLALSKQAGVSEVDLVKCPSAELLEVMLVLCKNLWCMCSVSKTSLCPLLLLFPWHCYPLTSSKAMVCTNTNCYAPPSPPPSPHTYSYTGRKWQ